MAIFVQTLSAKLGIATGDSLPNHCGRVFSRTISWGLWSVGTVAAMATDLAEFLGGVLGFHLLLGIPMIWAAVLTVVVAYIICHMEKYGQIVIERIIITAKKDTMGEFANSRLTNVVAFIIVTLIVALNAVLFYLLVTGQA